MSEYRVYVAHRGSGPQGNGVTAMDPDSGALLGTGALPAAPLALARRESDTDLAVLLDHTVELALLDTGSLTITGGVDLNDNVKTKAGFVLMHFSPDGRWLFLSGRRQVHIYDIDPAKDPADRRDPVVVAASDRSEDILQIQASPDGDSVYIRQNGRITRINVTTGKVATTNGGLAFRSFAVHPGGSALYTSAGALVLRLDATTLNETARTQLYGDRQPYVAVAPEGTSVYASVHKTYGLVTLHNSPLDPTTLESQGESTRRVFDQEPVWTPDGRLVTFAGNRVVVLDLADTGPLASAKLPGTVTAVCCAPAPDQTQ